MLSNKHNSAATNVWDVERDEYCNKGYNWGKESLTALYPNCGESLINSGGIKIKLIPPEFDDKKRTYGALLQYSYCSTSQTLVAAELCLFDSIEWSTLILEMIDIDNNLFGQWTLKTWLVWTMDIEDVWSMDIEEYVERDDTYTRISTIIPDIYPWHLSRVPIWTVFQSFCSCW